LAEDIDYIQIGPPELGGTRFQINEALFSGQFTPAGSVADIRGGVFAYYDVAASCGDVAVAAR
jgi:hypothetical protein